MFIVFLQQTETMQKIITYIFIVLILTSCGSLKKLNPEEIAIRKAVTDNDLYSLIDIHSSSNEYRIFIEDYLSSVSFIDYSYSDIMDFERYSKKDSTLFMIFKDARITRESLVIESLAEMPLDSLASYYINNIDEHVFIYPVLYDNLIKDLGAQDYRYIKALHNAFLDSDLSPQIDSVYLPLRQDLLIQVKEQLRKYFHNETTTLSELHKSAYEYAQQTLSTNLPIIIDSTLNKVNRDIFDKLIKNESYDHLNDKDYIIKLVDKYLSEDDLKSGITRPIEEYIYTCNSSRIEIIETYIDDEISNKDLLLETLIDTTHHLDFSFKSIDEIEFAKAITTLYDVGSIALGFATAGASELILDAADFAFGFWMENRKSKKITNSIQQFSNDLASTYNNTAQSIISSYFEPLEQQLTTTQSNLEKYVEENF